MICVKVKPWNWKLLKRVWLIFGVILATVSALLTFCDFNSILRMKILFSMLFITFFTYLGLLLQANFVKSAKLHSDNASIEIKEGDIFDKKYYDDSNFIKVFSFNEYFDTLVDDKIIAHSTLNGQFLDKKVDKKDISQLDKRMLEDGRLIRNRVGETSDRNKGKKIKYRLGTIFEYSDDVFFTALSHFDMENKAQLSMQEFLQFLIYFWDEIDDLYAGRTVIITLFGSGITRLENGLITNDQILKIVLWTFKLRRIKFTKPAKFIILLNSETNKKINYFKLKDEFNNGI